MKIERDSGPEAIIATQCVAYTLGHEGKDLTDIPDDLGGRTKFGITQLLLDEIGEKYKVFLVDDLDEAKAIEIYTKEFFKPASCGRIHNAVLLAEQERSASNDRAEAVALLFTQFHFDAAVNHGIGNAVKIMQRALNLINRKGELYADIEVDGGFGGNTMQALKLCLEHRGAKNLFQAMCSIRTAYYIRITEYRKRNETFIAGWLNRVGDFYKRSFEVFK